METAYEFIKITSREFVADRLVLRAFALTFGTILSLLPLLAILFSLFKILGGGDWFLNVAQPALSVYFAPGIQPIVFEKIARLIENFAAKTVGGVSVLILLAGIHMIFASVEATFNLIWGGSPRRRFLTRAPIYWGLFLTIPLLLATAIIITTYIIALPLTAEVSTHISNFGEFIRRLIPASMIIICFILIYKYLTSAIVAWRSAIYGGIIAGILYELSKNLFIIYAGKMMRYDLLYGSVAILPMAMIWINISWVIALFGIEFAYVHQHFQTLRREQKHVRLSRRQQDALAIRLLMAAIPDTDAPRSWIDIGSLAEQWELPPGSVYDAVERLERAGLLKVMRKNREQIKVEAGIEDLTLSEIEYTLNASDREAWRWPSDPLWNALRESIHQAGSVGNPTNVTIKRLIEKPVKNRTE